MVRLKTIGAVAAVAAGLVTATAAGAAPFSLGVVDGGDVIQRVAGGCGPGFHPNRFGDCRPNDRGYGYGYGGPRGYYDGPRRFYGGPDRGYGGGYDRPRRYDYGY